MMSPLPGRDMIMTNTFLVFFRFDGYWPNIHLSAKLFTYDLYQDGYSLGS